MSGRLSICLSAGVLVAACGTTPVPPAPAPLPVPQKPLASGLVPVDPSLDPCVDFEVYACGPRYNTQSSLYRPGDLVGASGGARRRLLDKVMAGQHAGDFVASSMVREHIARCLDPSARARGLADLRSELVALSIATNLGDLARRLGHLRALGQSILVNLTPIPRLIDAPATVIARIGLTGPVMPAEFYSPVRRAVGQNRDHWENLARLSGLAEEGEAVVASQVDRWLAVVHPTSADDGRAKTTIDRAQLLRRRFPWAAYFDGLGQNVAGPFMVADSEGLSRVDGLATLPLAALKSYARVLLIEQFAMLLTQELLDEEYRYHFMKYNYVMTGSWSFKDACRSTLPGPLREAVGLAYLAPLADREAEGRGQLLFDGLRDLLVYRMARTTAGRKHSSSPMPSRSAPWRGTIDRPWKVTSTSTRRFCCASTALCPRARALRALSLASRASRWPRSCAAWRGEVEKRQTATRIYGIRI